MASNIGSDNGASAKLKDSMRHGQKHSVALRLPQIHNFLCDNDIDRAPDWMSKTQKIKEYLYLAQELRQEDDAAFKSPHITALLDECMLLLKSDRWFQTWTRGKTEYAPNYNIKTLYSKRIRSNDRNADESQYLNELTRTRLTSIPRPHWVLYSPYYRPTGWDDQAVDWDKYFSTEDGNQVFRGLVTFSKDEESASKGDTSGVVTADNPAGNNYSRLENAVYEQCVNTGLEGTQSVMRTIDDGTKSKLERQFTHRGAKRAGIQQVLNLLTNSENKAMITPWRAVVFPEPIQPKHQQVFMPRALPRDKKYAAETGHSVPERMAPRPGAPDVTTEPSPWIYWHNQYQENINFLASTMRHISNRIDWKKLDKIALPVNYRGPYTFSNMSIYDDYWMKMRKTLRTLNKNLRVTAGIQPKGRRPLMDDVISDIAHGLVGNPRPKDITPRGPDLRDRSDKDPSSFRLIDETEMEWLRFLNDPPSSRGLVGVPQMLSQDDRMILFDHRIQNVFNDRSLGMFWDKEEVEITSDKTTKASRYRLKSKHVPLAILLQAINGGNSHVTQPKLEYMPNKLYQFTADEAKSYCVELARMGRLSYQCPVPASVIDQMPQPQPDDINQCEFYASQNPETDGGSVGVMRVEIWPEERIIWRLCNLGFAYVQPRIGDPETELHHESPHWEDMLDYSDVLEKSMTTLPQTTQFFRNLAYRLGRTLHYLRELKARTSRPPGFNRGDLNKALDRWQSHVEVSMMPESADGETWTLQYSHERGEVEITVPGKDGPERLENRRRVWPVQLTDSWKAGSWKHIGADTGIRRKPDSVAPSVLIERVNRRHPVLGKKNAEDHWAVIRHGLIDDAVNNRTMLYPGRLRVKEYEAVLEDGTRTTRYGEVFDRVNIWSWANEPIRENTRLMKRERYFSMNRWPLHRQTTETQKKISSRLDEFPGDRTASYLLPEKVLQQQPFDEDSVAYIANNVIYTLLGETGLKLVGWNQSAEQDQDEDEEMQGSDQNSSTELIRSTKRSTPYVGTSSSSSISLDNIDVIQKFIVALSQRRSGQSMSKPWEEIMDSMDVEVDPSMMPWSTLRPITQETEMFIPGPATFPMGDTQLAQLEMSRELEAMLDPRLISENTMIGRWIEELNQWLQKGERVTLLPEIETRRVPASSDRKRKLPTMFEDPPTKRLARTRLGYVEPEKPEPVPLSSKKTRATSSFPPPRGKKEKEMENDNNDDNRSNSSNSSNSDDDNNNNRDDDNHTPPPPPSGGGDGPKGPPPSGLQPASAARPIRRPTRRITPGNLPSPPLEVDALAHMTSVMGQVVQARNPGIRIQTGSPNYMKEPFMLSKPPMFARKSFGRLDAPVELPPSYSSRGSPRWPKAPTAPRTPWPDRVKLKSLAKEGTADKPINIQDQTQPKPPTKKVKFDLTPKETVKAPEVEDVTNTSELILAAKEPATKKTELPPYDPERNPALHLFRSYFPHGYNKLPTSASGLLCGLHALRISVENQHPDLPPPELPELQQILQDEVIPEQAAFFVDKDDALLNPREWTMESNITVGALSAALMRWGARRGVELQIGVLRDQGPPYFSPTPLITPRTVWVWNDQSESMATTTDLVQGKRKSTGIGHWMGVSARGAKSGLDLMLRRFKKD